jgi:hypothetical protein
VRKALFEQKKIMKQHFEEHKTARLKNAVNFLVA